jgi:hypothetical protein
MLGARSCRSAETQTRAHPGDLRDRIASAEAEARTGTEIELRKKSPRAWLLQNRKPTVQSQPEPEPPRRGHRRALRVDIAKVEKLASRALTIEQIAPRIGMARQTLFTKRRLNPAIYDAIEKGKAAGIEEMANKLFDDGLAGNTTAQIFYLKARAGWRDQGPIVEVNNQQQNVQVRMDPAVLAGKVTLLRDAILLLKSHGIPVARELERRTLRPCRSRSAARANQRSSRTTAIRLDPTLQKRVPVRKARRNEPPPHQFTNAAESPLAPHTK